MNNTQTFSTQELESCQQTMQMHGTKTCNNCFEVKDRADYNANKMSKDGIRGNCKQCQSEQAVNAAVVKDAERKPYNYMSCDNCDRTFSRFKKGPRGKQLTVEQCKYCGSSEIDDY